MTDQEFLSQNLDVLLQDLWFPSIAKDIMLSDNLIPTTIKVAFFTFFIVIFTLFVLNVVLFSRGSSKVAEKEDNPNNSPKKISKTERFFVRILISAFFSIIFTAFMWIVLYLSSDYSLSSNYIKLDDLSKLPVLKDGNSEKRNYFKEFAKNYIVYIEAAYQNQDEFNEVIERGPKLYTVAGWLTKTIKDKPYKKQKIADEKLKLINDM